MRNRLLFTAALFCVEMTPFGGILAPVYAADLAGGQMVIAGIQDGDDSPSLVADYNDPVINEVYRDNVPYYTPARDNSGALVYDQDGNVTYQQAAPTDTQAAQILQSEKTDLYNEYTAFRKKYCSTQYCQDYPNTISNIAAGASSTNPVQIQSTTIVSRGAGLAGEVTASLNGGGTIDLNSNYVLVNAGGPDDVFTGTLTDNSAVLTDNSLVQNGKGLSFYDLSSSGGLIVDSSILKVDSPSTSTFIASARGDVVTLAKGQSQYNGYTLVRGTGVLALTDGASITTHGIVTVGQSSYSSATMIVDRGSKLSVTAMDSNPLIQAAGHGNGELIVGNGDVNFADRTGPKLPAGTVSNVADTTTSYNNTLDAYNAATNAGSIQQAADSNVSLLNATTGDTHTVGNNKFIVQNGGEVDADTVAVTNYATGSGIIDVSGTDASGKGSLLNVGYGGITVNAGTGALFIEHGGVVNNSGIISLGDAQANINYAKDKTTGNISTYYTYDADTVRATLGIGQGGTLIAGDAYPRMPGSLASFLTGSANLNVNAALSSPAFLQALNSPSASPTLQTSQSLLGALPSFFVIVNGADGSVTYKPVTTETFEQYVGTASKAYTETAGTSLLYGLLKVDGIAANFGTAGVYAANIATTSGQTAGSAIPTKYSVVSNKYPDVSDQYRVYINDGTLANRSSETGSSWSPLHTSANIDVAGTATFNTVDDPSGAGSLDSLVALNRISQGLSSPFLPTTLDTAGITIGGDLSDIKSSSTTSSSTGSISGGVRVAGGGTLVLLGRNSYTGPTTVTGGSTLQLGGFVDTQDTGSAGIASGNSTYYNTATGAQYSTASQYEARIVDQRNPAALFGQTGIFANSGTIASSSPVTLVSDKTNGVVTPTGLSTLNLAWSAANSLWRNVGNTISGDGQILRDVKGELQAPIAAAVPPSLSLSYVNLSGNITLSDASNGTKPSVYVQNGYLSVGPQLDTDSSGQLTVNGQRGGVSQSVVDGQKGNLSTNGTILIGNDGSDTGQAGQNFNLKTLATSASAAQAAVQAVRENEQNLTANPQFSIRHGGTVYANQVIMEGAVGGTLYNGSQDSSVPGGTLTIGQGGLRIGNNFSPTDPNTPVNSQYAGVDQPFVAHVSNGGVIQNAGVVTLGYQGELDVGDATDAQNQAKGTLIAGDVGTQAGITALTPTGNLEKDPALKVWYNGVIQNRAGSDLHINSDVQVADYQNGQHPTFDTNGQNMYLTGKVTDEETRLGTAPQTGSLEKTGSGTLFISNNANSYTGDTLVNEGTLTLTGAGNITSSSGVTVENGAIFNGNTYTSGVDGQTQTGAAAQTTVNAGGVLEVSDNQSNTSQASIGGTGINNTGVFNIGAPGSTAQNLTMQSSGTAHSILSVGGDSTANKNSALQSVALNVTGYDRAGGVIATTGTAINGTFTFLNSGVVNVQGSADIGSATINFQRNDAVLLHDGDAYRILTTTNGLTHSAGNDNALTGGLLSLPYLSPYLVYEANAVDILLKRTSVSFAGPCRTRNECETGAGAGSLPTNNAVATALTGITTPEEARRALNSLSGEIHASARTALIEDSALLETAVLDRLDEAGCDGAGGLPTHGRYDFYTGRKESDCYADHAVLWGQAYGSMGRNYNDGNAGPLHHQSTGFIMGIDTPLDERWRLGGMVAYGRSMFNTSGTANASGNSNNISIGAYTGSHWGRLNLRLGGFYSWNLLNTRREAQVADVGGRQTSHYRDGTARVFGELGYKMRFDKADFEPFVGMSYVNQYAGSFQERGAAGLSGRGEDMGVIYSSAGFRTAYNFEIGEALFQSHFMAAYRHAFGGIVASRTERFIGGTTDMSLGGVPLSRDSALVKAGLTARLTDRIDVDVSYIGQYGNISMDNGATGSIHFAF